MIKKLYPFFLLLILFITSCTSSQNGITGLPEGELLASYDSLDSQYTINMYLCNGGATVDYSLRGELVINSSGTKKNIYWNYHETTASVKWIDSETVNINGHTINILNEVYDFRWD